MNVHHVLLTLIELIIRVREYTEYAAPDKSLSVQAIFKWSMPGH